MHIRQIPLYALAAGALAVSVLLFGDDDGADAATEAASGAVTETVTEAAPAVDTAHAVVVEPDPVAPGGAFSVHDGGSCSGDTADATFDGADIPAMRLTSGSDGMGGSAILPHGHRARLVRGHHHLRRQVRSPAERHGRGPGPYRGRRRDVRHGAGRHRRRTARKGIRRRPPDPHRHHGRLR